MHRTVRYIAAGIGAAALIGGAGTGIVLAQSGGGTAANERSAALAVQPGNGSAIESTLVLLQQASSDTFIADLAKNLGKTEQEVRDALKKTALDQVDKAVADGKITKEQADRLRAAIASGNGSLFGIHAVGGPGGGDRSGHGGPFHFEAGGPMDQLQDLEGFLEITGQQLREELNSGKTPAEIAVSHGKTRDQLKQFLTAKNDERIQKAVADGKLTADEAKKRKEGFASNLDKLVDAKIQANVNGRGPRPGGPGGPKNP